MQGAQKTRRERVYASGIEDRDPSNLLPPLGKENGMGLIERLFGKGLKASPDQGLSRLQAISREQTRRELMAMALRDTLKKHGLAAGSITPDALSGIVGGRQRGMHVQLVFKEIGRAHV